MKAKLFSLLIVILFCNGVFAQSAIADLKFEEAEIAFNQSDYQTTLTKLDEFDKAFGSVTAKSLYLRIVSQNNVLSKKHLMPWIYYLLADDYSFRELNEIDIDAGVQIGDVILAIDGKDKSTLFEYIQTKTVDDFVVLTLGRKKTNEQIKTKIRLVAYIDDEEFTDFNSLFCQSRLLSNENNFIILSSLRKNVSSYLQAMESEGLDDKYREVYTISEKLKQYPADKQAWLKDKQRIETDRLLKIAEKERKEEELETYYRELAVKIDEWEYQEGIKIGGDFEVLKKQYPELFNGLKKHPSLKSQYFSTVSKTETLVSLGLDYTDRSKISYYSVNIYLSKSDDFNKKQKEMKTEMDKLKQMFKTIFGDSLIFENENDVTFTIISPYSNCKIEVQNDYFSIKLTKSKK